MVRLDGPRRENAPLNMAATPYTSFATRAWIFGEPVAGPKGGQQHISVYREAGLPLRAPKLQLCVDGDESFVVERLGEGRARLHVAQNEELRGALAELDAFALEQAAARCQSWFNRAFTAAQLEAMLRPVAPSLEQGEAWSLDLELAPRAAAWSLSEDGSYVRIAPEDVPAGREIWACVEVSGLVFAPRHFGVSLTLTDLLLLPERPEEPAFPFSSGILSFRPRDEVVAAAT
jgi:hypothetical protein